MASPLFYLSPFMLLLLGKTKLGKGTRVVGPFIDSLPPNHGSLRNQMILDEVRRKIEQRDWDTSDIGWTTVRSKHGDLIADIPVTADALKLDGIRINGTFVTGQKLADMLGVYQLTPHVSRLINQQAGYWITPSDQLWQGKGTDNSGTKTYRMVDHSRIVDDKLRNAKIRPNGNPYLMVNAGKLWVNSSRNWENPAHGANYGWYKPNGSVIQTVGMFHDLSHEDYSQVFRFMGNKAMLSHAKGIFQPHSVTLKTLFETTETKPLIVGNDVNLPELRHPGIPAIPQVAAIV